MASLAPRENFDWFVVRRAGRVPGGGESLPLDGGVADCIAGPAVAKLKVLDVGWRSDIFGQSDCDRAGRVQSEFRCGEFTGSGE